jgi:hypothetical protein
VELRHRAELAFPVEADGFNVIAGVLQKKRGTAL